MANRDDMVIRPQAERASLRERAREGWKKRKAEWQRNDMRRRGRRALSRRSRGLGDLASAGRKTRKDASKDSFKGIRQASKVGLKALNVAGWVAESAILAGQTARRVQGLSGRRIEAQDMHTMYGDLDDRSAAASHVRQGIESDRELLRIIGYEGRVNSQIKRLAESMRTFELDRVRGVDAIDRSAAFDSADSLMDKAFKGLSEYARVELSGKLRESVTLLKASGLFGGSPR